MATNQTRRRRLASIVILLTVTTAGIALGTGTATAADVSVEELNIANESRTIGGSVSDVTLSATLGYNHNVPDADRRQVKLLAGRSTDDLELVDYRQTRDPDTNTSGSVTLSGSLFDNTPLSPSDVTPPAAGTTTTEFVVRAVVNIPRANGDAVRHVATDTATLTLTDDAQLSATVGGSGAITVTTG